MIRLLVVEDHPITLKGLQTAFLADEAIEIVGAARTCAEGLSMAESLQPDVVLLDLHLPNCKPKSMTTEFINRVGASRIVVFTAEDRPAFVSAMLDLKIAGYLSKSEPLSVVAQFIRKAAAGYRRLLSLDLVLASPPPLTRKELQTLEFVAKGASYEEIATVGSRANSAVRKQCERLRKKLAVDSPKRLAVWAAHNGYGLVD